MREIPGNLDRHVRAVAPLARTRPSSVLRPRAEGSGASHAHTGRRAVPFLPDRSAAAQGEVGWTMDPSPMVHGWMGGADRAGEISPSRLGWCAGTGTGCSLEHSHDPIHFTRVPRATELS